MSKIYGLFAIETALYDAEKVIWNYPPQIPILKANFINAFTNLKCEPKSNCNRCKKNAEPDDLHQTIIQKISSKSLAVSWLEY